MVNRGRSNAIASRFDVSLAESRRRAPVIVLERGQTVRDLSDLVPRDPDRVRANVSFDNVESFVAYLLEWKKPETRVFASVLAAPYRFTAMIDYHAPECPSWLTHVAVLTLSETDEWRTWMASNEKGMEQVAFAQFIEQNLNDVVKPDGATMMELALTLEASQDVQFKGRINLGNGDVGLVSDVKTDMKAGADGQIVIPKEMDLRLPVFRGVPAVELKARFRTVLKGAALSMGYQIIRPKAVVDKMVAGAADLVRHDGGVTVFSGSVDGALDRR